MRTVVRHHLRRTRGGVVPVRRHVRTVSKRVLLDYAGMNRPAAESLGFRPKPRQGEVLVASDLPPGEKRRTIRHEEVEAELMRRGYSYWDAHKIALRSERQKEYIKGGLGGHLPDEAFDKRSLQAGVKVEMEHTNNPSVAKEIARDHLTEDSRYYQKLKKCHL